VLIGSADDEGGAAPNIDMAGRDTEEEAGLLKVLSLQKLQSL
jgi:hypothetical protein